MIGGTIGAIDHQLQSLEVQVSWKSAFAELDITACGIHHAICLTQLARGRHPHGLFKLRLNSQLYLIRKFGAFTGEELDAVILKRVMRGTDNNPGIGMQRASKIRNCRCRHRAQQQNIDPGS